MEHLDTLCSADVSACGGTGQAKYDEDGDTPLTKISLPPDLSAVLDAAWKAARDIPGFLTEEEARFLGLVAACAPGAGSILEIGSFKGKSTVMLATVARHYNKGRVVAIDPHNFNNPELQEHRTEPDATSYNAFMSNLRSAGVVEAVDVHREFSTDVAKTWSGPIRFLWIDGDHGYRGAKADFDGFMRHVVPGGVVALHDALHEFAGPIRVFVEDVLRSDRFGAAGFVHSTGWAQFRPADGGLFRDKRASLELAAKRLIPFVKDETALQGLRKIQWKLNRSRVPHAPIGPEEWVGALTRKV